MPKMPNMNQMIYHMGFVVKLKPTREQKHLIAVNDGAARSVYNHLVACDNERYRLRKSSEYVPSYRSRICYLNSVSQNPKDIKNALPYLYGKDVDEQAIANAIQNHKRAWKNMKELHSGVPTWKKKSYEQSYQTNAHYYKNGGCNVRFESKKRVTLPKLGTVSFQGSPKLVSMVMQRKDIRIGTITISRDTVGEYWASFALGSMNPFHEPFTKTGKMCGIDLNLIDLVNTSLGTSVPNKRFLRVTAEKLAKEQHKLSRKYEAYKRSLKKDDIYDYHHCRSYQKQRVKVAYTHRKIARQRNEYLHNISKQLIENQDVVVAEALKVRNLVKNHKLARAISDAGWRTLLTYLQYKAESYGKTVFLVPPQYTSQTCSVCGHVLKGEERLTLADREWNCPVCQTHHLRDVNAAEVILQRGLSLLSNV